MKTILTALFQFFSALFSPAGSVGLTIFTAGVTIITVFTWINTQIATYIAKLDLLIVTSFGGTLNIAPIGLLNTFIPLTEAIAYFGAFLAVLGTCAAVRIVKSFIPTVAT